MSDHDQYAEVGVWGHNPPSGKCAYCADTGWIRSIHPTIRCTACPKGGAAYISPPAASPVPPSAPRCPECGSEAMRTSPRGSSGESFRCLNHECRHGWPAASTEEQRPAAVPQEAPAASEPTLIPRTATTKHLRARIAALESENARLTRELRKSETETLGWKVSRKENIESLRRELAKYREVVERECKELDEVGGATLDEAEIIAKAIYRLRASLPPDGS